MDHAEQDAAFARLILESGLANAVQLQQARYIQSSTVHRGRTLSLSECFVRAGAITPSQRDTFEKKCRNGSHTPPPDSKPSAPRIGAYSLLNKLGEGGMGTVYLAKDINADRLVALKILLPEFTRKPDLLERFRHEAQSTGRLNHANIVSANCFGEDRGYYYYVMEYCEGETLEAILKRSGMLPIEHALECMMQVAEGLRYAHAHGCIHRDIKPANIMISREGEVKILDLGLSKTAQIDDSRNTAAGIALGTPHYISPEQARGDPNIDGRCDMYALGGTLYHIVTGQTPFDGPTAAVIMTKHLTEAPRNPRGIREEISDAMVQVIRKLMAKQPADRYATMEQVLEDLRSLKSGRSPKHAVSAEANFLTETRVANRTKFMKSSERRAPHSGGVAHPGPATRAVASATRAVSGMQGPPPSRLVATYTESAPRAPGTRMVPTQSAHGPMLHIPPAFAAHPVSAAVSAETPEPFIQAAGRPIPGLQTPPPPRRNGNGSEAGSRMGIAAVARRTTQSSDRPGTDAHSKISAYRSLKLFALGAMIGLSAVALWFNFKPGHTPVASAAESKPTTPMSVVERPTPEVPLSQTVSAQAAVLPAGIESLQPQDSPKESFARRKLKEILELQKSKGRSDDIRSRLDDLVKNYGTTQAGKEAANILNITYGSSTAQSNSR